MGFFSGIGEKMDGGISGIGDAMSSTFSTIGNGARNAAEWTGDRVNDAKDGIGNVASTTGEFIGDRASDVKDGAEFAADKAKEGGEAVVNNTKDRVHSFIDPRGFQEDILKDMNKEDGEKSGAENSVSCGVPDDVKGEDTEKAEKGDEGRTDTQPGVEDTPAPAKDEGPEMG